MSKLQEIKSSVQAKRRLQELKSNLYGTVEVLMMSEIEWLISQLEQAQAENEQLKADKQKLVEALELIREDSKEDGIHSMLDRCYATAYHTLRALSEVKGNG